jgi:hypothetical protein
LVNWLGSQQVPLTSRTPPDGQSVVGAGTQASGLLITKPVGHHGKQEASVTQSGADPTGHLTQMPFGPNTSPGEVALEAVWHLGAQKPPGTDTRLGRHVHVPSGFVVSLAMHTQAPFGPCTWPGGHVLDPRTQVPLISVKPAGQPAIGSGAGGSGAGGGADCDGDWAGTSLTLVLMFPFNSCVSIRTHWPVVAEISKSEGHLAGPRQT